jgi:hypothetical protein
MEVRRNVGWVQLRGDSQVLDRFFETAAFLDEFIPEPVTAQKALWVFGDHLFERIKIHTRLLDRAGRMIPL